MLLRPSDTLTQSVSVEAAGQRHAQTERFAYPKNTIYADVGMPAE